MDSRRKFVGQVAYGLAGTLATGPGRVLGATDRVRIGIIGAGDRGMELANLLRTCPNTDIVSVADIYDRNRDRAAALTGAKSHTDHRSLLDSRDVDAVVIATPQHLHARHFCDSIGAGKHVYLEKTAAFTVAEAKQMRSAYRASTKVVQIGHQACSTGHVSDVAQFLSDRGRMGKITAIAMQMHRNTPLGKPQWSRPALLTPELNESSVNWTAFDPRGFDANRFVHWRYFWDYSGGTIFEHMSQQLAFWYKLLDLGIPNAASMQGGIHLWKDGREVPDTVSVTLQQPEDLMISWVSGLGNNQIGIGEEVLGTNGTISRATQVRYTPQKVNRPDLKEWIGRTPHTPQAHIQSFLDAIQTGSQSTCPFDLGYRVSIACRMAVESYLQGRTVRWDARREEIV